MARRRTPAEQDEDFEVKPLWTLGSEDPEEASQIREWGSRWTDTTALIPDLVAYLKELAGSGHQSGVRVVESEETSTTLLLEVAESAIFQVTVTLKELL